MISNLQPYPEYKESGLAWSPELPAHWSKERAKWLFTKMERPVGDGDGVVTCFRDGMVTLRKNRRLRGFTEAIYELGYQGIRKGDLVIHAMDAFAGAVGVSDSDGKGTPVYAVCQPNPGVNAHYYAFIVREMARSQWILALSRGIRERSTDFRYETFGGQRVPLPPPDEQAAMVRFLDYANRRLERAIRAKRKVIALLHEQKQAIIHRAVTRGLAPTVPHKPSGIPWLGDIPTHWEVQRLKFLAHIKTGGRDTVDRIDGGPYPFFVRSQTVERIDTFSFDGEAVLTAGDGAGVGKVFHYVNGKFEYHQRVYKFSNFRRITGKFFFHYLKSSLRFEALDASAKSTVDSLRLPLLQNFPTVLPPTSEQHDIVKWIDTESRPVDTAISRLEREIALLREYRTRLVADVVTGKLDVRPAARQLPAEPDAPEPAPNPEELTEPEEAVPD
jgi:type I restriction enzyme S subunit